MPKAFFFALKFLERTTGHMHVPQSAQIYTCGEVIFEGAFLFQFPTLLHCTVPDWVIRIKIHDGQFYGIFVMLLI